MAAADIVSIRAWATGWEAALKTLHLCSLVGLLALGSAPNAAHAAVIGGPIASGGSLYYLLSSNTWTGAELEAVSLGGHLVTINDAAENTFVILTFQNFGGVPHSLWLGMTDQASEGTFVWISGEPVTFTGWWPGEPNQCGGEEDYVHTFPPTDARSGGWNDLMNGGCGGCGQCFDPNGVVEVPLATPVPPTTWGKLKQLYR